MWLAFKRDARAVVDRAALQCISAAFGPDALKSVCRDNHFPLSGKRWLRVF